MSKPKFNLEQQAAIDASSKHNILISAGAGSGKTKTLSERVFRLIDSGEVLPSSLLVLTFTNNAAHEMKERIIARFKEAGSHLAEEMPSAHIQTFDSFSQYLVSTYAGRLGLSNQIKIANASVMDAKKAVLLDQVLNRYYEDPELRKRLFATFKKFATRDEKKIKSILLDLDRQLEKMLPSAKKEFIERYDERFLSDDACDKFLSEFIEEKKQVIISALYEAYFLERHYEDVVGETRTPERAKQAFADEHLFQKDYSTFLFDEKYFCQAIYEAILPMLDKQGMDFVLAVQGFEMAYGHIGKSVLKKNLADPDAEERVKAIWKPMRSLFFTEKALLSDVKGLGDDKAKIYGLIQSFGEDIHLFFDIIVELENALFDYKKSINTFTFADISTLALRLVSEPEYEDIAKELRGRFKYIMVDEYQDTNDFQEVFINSLLQPDEHGDAAHLFCVGDAKQSIYAFRNSNVALFRARQAAYERSSVDEVIHMNRNYRSGKPLLSQINYIFERYMTLRNGSIEYADKKEQLTYDDEVDIYGKPYDHFGIYRILPPKEVSKKDQRDYEAHAIISTIVKMIEEGYPVYDRAIGGLRPCQYRDFAILTRQKKSFTYYQSLFNEAGIPLNVSVTANLREIDAIILLQSILSLIAWKRCDIECDVKHLFASVARSYAYQYSDDQIYDLITKDDDLASILADPIMQSIDAFCACHEESSFSTIFLDLLSAFHIIDRLYLIGDVDNNIAKIESLHQMVLSEEKAGEGLPEFVRLFGSIKKYELDLSVENDFEIENSVDLMTIHASKGLERKIIFLPSSQNKISRGNPMTKPSYDFSSRYGVLLPNYILPEDEDSGTVYSLPYRLFRNHQKEADPEMDEHVRLLYVALTRAENAIYIVGDDPHKEGSLYEMLSSIPHYEAFNDKLVAEKLSEGVLSQSDYDHYLALVGFTQNAKLPLAITDLGEERYATYEAIADKYFKAPEEDALTQLIEKMKLNLYSHYHDIYSKRYPSDLDFQAKLYAAYHYPDAKVDTFRDLAAYISSLWAQPDEEEPEYELHSGLLGQSQAKQAKPSHVNHAPSEEDIRNQVEAFGKAVLDEDCGYFGLKPKEGEEHKSLAKELLNAYASALDGYDDVLHTSYASADYPDTTLTCPWNKNGPHGVFSLHIYDLPKSQINDDPIKFKVREQQRASKKQTPTDDDTPVKQFLGRGVRLHRLMELVDWEKKDASFIPSPKDRALVESVISLPIIKTQSGGKFLPEYGYYDEDLKTTGFIDLLIIKDGMYTIIDWKTKNIDDDAYGDQLHVYQRNVQRIFGVDKEHIRLALVSLADQQVKMVEAE